MLMGILQLKQQQKEAEQRNTLNTNQFRTQALDTFTNIVRNTADPSKSADLAVVGERLGLGSRDEVMRILNNIQPTQAATQSWVARGQLNNKLGLPSDLNVTPEAAGTVNETMNRFLSGMTSGETAGSGYTSELFKTAGAPTAQNAGDFIQMFLNHQTPGTAAVDRAVSNLPPEQLGKAAQIQTGLEMNAGQAGNLRLGSESLRFQVKDSMIKNAIDQARIYMAKGAGQGGQISTNDLPGLYNTQHQLMDFLQKNKGSMSDVEAQDYINTLNGVNQLIKGLQSQLLPPTGNTPGLMNPGQMTQPGPIGSFWNFLGSFSK